MKRGFVIAVLLILSFAIFPASALAISTYTRGDVVGEVPNEITENAKNMVLSINDFEPGWTLHKQNEVAIEDALSAYHVYFYEGTMYPSVIQNTVAVFANEDIAKEKYAEEKPTNVSLDNPGIGDECFLNISVEINKLLVFRIENVVVWVKLQQDYFKDIEKYARIVEQRVNSFTEQGVDAPLASPTETVKAPEIVAPPTEIPTATTELPPEPPATVPKIVIPSIEIPTPTAVLPPEPPNVPPISEGILWGTIFMGVIMWILGIAAYFVPSIIAFARKKRNKVAILLLNIFTGWTFIGWVISLVWSVKHDS